MVSQMYCLKSQQRHYFQASFRSHASWLHAIVIPVFKKGPTSLTSNYRPISLTCVCCRVMERIINVQLLNYLYLHGLISKFQHGFLHKHSRCTNLLESVYDWSVALNNKLTIDIIYVDFQKAFDSVSHSKLLIKLEGYGIHADLLAWLKAFLSKRTQVVNVEGSFLILYVLRVVCLRAVFWVVSAITSPTWTGGKVYYQSGPMAAM